MSDHSPSPAPRLPGRVLITGAGGFIGSHLTELCLERGYEVRAFVHYRSDSGWGWLDECQEKSRLDVVSGDIRDFDIVHRAFRGCETVFHLAALIGIPYSYESPQAYIRTNVEGTYNVLESARQCGVKRLAITSTSETYGTAQFVPIDESHPSVAQSPYAATKIAADQLALSYHRSFDLPVWVVRPFNTYGPRQSLRAIIPTVVTQLLSGGTQIEVGNTRPTRDLTYVRDTAEGFLSILGCDALCGSVTNIGANREISIEDLIHRIAKLLDTEVTLTTNPNRLRPAASEVDRLFCNNERLCNSTEWQPQVSLDDGLLKTISFLKDRLAQFNSHRYHV